MKRFAPRRIDRGARSDRRLRMESLEPRALLAADFVISEFLAQNTTTHFDEDGDASDWIEIFNQGDSEGSLAGWNLTDDPTDLTKWEFPDVALPAGRMLVVFASGKNRTAGDSPLHTNFKLDQSGEFLALVRPDTTTIASQFAPSFPNQRDDISYGLEMEALTMTLVAEDAPKKALAPTDDSLGTSWTGASEPFDDTTWQAGTLGIGYDVGDVRTTLYVSNVRGVSPDSYDLPSEIATALPADPLGQVGNDRELLIGPDGSLFLAAINSGAVRKFDLDLQEWSTFAETTLPGSAGLVPSGMTFAADGNLYVSSLLENVGTIEKFDGTTGEHLDTIATGFNYPRGLAHADGILYLAIGNGSDTIRRYFLDGTSPGGTPAFISTGINPRGLTIGPNGNLFVAVIGPSGGPDGAIEQYDINTGALVGGGDWNTGGGLSVPLDIEFVGDFA